MAIEPTIGRIVWYTPSREQTESRHFGGEPLQPLAAIITYVHPSFIDTDGQTIYEVSLCVFSQTGQPVACQRVALVQPEGPQPAEGVAFCAWMPYQVGQAAKASEPAASAPQPPPAPLNWAPPADAPVEPKG